MNDLLYALYKERHTMNDRIHTIDLYIKKRSDVISKTPYTEEDLVDAKDRLKEVEAAIKAVMECRKNKVTNHQNQTK